MSAPTPGLRDERLCWLAVEEKLRRRSMRGTGFFIGLSSLVRSADVAFGAPGTARGFASAKMRKYAVAVDIVAMRLNPQEREVLRTTGEVPDWFLDEVLAEARKVKLR